MGSVTIRIAFKDISYRQHYDQEPRGIMLVVVEDGPEITYIPKATCSVWGLQRANLVKKVGRESLLSYDCHALAPMDHLKTKSS